LDQAVQEAIGNNLDPAAEKLNVSVAGPNQINSHTDFPSERGRKREERIAVANEEKSLAELGVREVMGQGIASVQNAFVDVQQAKQNLSLVQENLKSLCTLGQKKPAATVPIKVKERAKNGEPSCAPSA
jgi:outer membrane protein TolC